MDWKPDNYLTLTTVPATDCNFTAALGYASRKELISARDYLDTHPTGNKCRLAAVRREIKRRNAEGNEN